MVNYVSGGQKRVKIFKKREREFIHAIKNNISKDKLAKTAELLREAKLNAINVQSFSSKKISADESRAKKELKISYIGLHKSMNQFSYRTKKIQFY